MTGARIALAYWLVLMVFAVRIVRQSIRRWLRLD